MLNHVYTWKWIQIYKSQKIASKKKNVDGFFTAEAVIKVGLEAICLWAAIESNSKEILAISLSKELNMFVVAERRVSGLIKIRGEHPVSTDDSTWCPYQACKFLKSGNYFHSPFEKSIIERGVQYLKYGTDGCGYKGRQLAIPRSRVGNYVRC